MAGTATESHPETPAVGRHPAVRRSERRSRRRSQRHTLAPDAVLCAPLEPRAHWTLVAQVPGRPLTYSPVAPRAGPAAPTTISATRTRTSNDAI